MSEVFLSVDGHSMAFRSFYAMRPENFHTKSGIYTNAVHGFISTMLYLIERVHPTHMCVAFDLPGGTFRTREYGEYKGGRKETPQEFHGQIDLIKLALDAMGIAFAEVEDFEADDIIATTSRASQEAGMRSYLCSGDRDAFQLVTDSCTLFYPKSGQQMEELTPAAIEKKRLVPPHLYPDLAALVGEKADNLPGVPKVGPKTAAKWLREYGSLEQVLAHAEDISGVVGQNLRNSIEDVRRNRRLNQLVSDLPLGKDLTRFAMRGLDFEAFSLLCDELEFRTIRTRVAKVLPPRALVHPDNSSGSLAGAPSLYTADERVDSRLARGEVTITTSGFEKWLESKQIDNSGSTLALSFLGESAPGVCDMQGLVCAVSQTEAYIWDDSTASAQDTKAIQAFLIALKEGTQNEAASAQAEQINPSMRILCHGKKQLMHAIQARFGCGKALASAHDTMLAAYLLHPDQKKFDIDSLAMSELRMRIDGQAFENAETHAHEKKAGQGKKGDLLNGAAGALFLTDDEREQRNRLAAVRTCILFPLMSVLCEQLEEESEHFAQLLELESSVASVLFSMEDAGIAVDSSTLNELHAKADGEVTFAERAAEEAVGERINLNSPKQIGELLFDKLALPPSKKTQRGYSTNAESLADLYKKIALREDESAVAGIGFLDALTAYRESVKRKQTLEGLIRAVRADGRIHTTYEQAVAATGRLSSVEPNLQNIHARTAEGREIREAFVAGSGFDGLLTADYSQIEMRLMAHLSGDSELIEAFRHGADLHTFVASRVYGVAQEDVSSEQRSHIKAMSYGLVYGLSAFGLSKQLGISVGKAQRLMDDYFTRFGKVRDYLRSLVEEARVRGYTESLYGRRRYLPDLRSDNRQVREAAERMALNAPIQGSAADMIKWAMVNVAKAFEREGVKSRMLLQVHDELVVEVARGEREKVEEIIRREMTGVWQLSVPLEVSVGFGHSWRVAAH